MPETQIVQGVGAKFSERPREACGIFGIDSPREEAVPFTYYGLHAVQHRGQESAGIAVSDGSSINVQKRMGLVDRLYAESDISQFHIHYSSACPIEVRCTRVNELCNQYAA